jgi:hypothetical protein
MKIISCERSKLNFFKNFKKNAANNPIQIPNNKLDRNKNMKNIKNFIVEKIS